MENLSLFPLTPEDSGKKTNKAILRDQTVCVCCSLIERKAIQAKAKSLGLSTSEFIRQIALKIEDYKTPKRIPKEWLQLINTLYHQTATLNQIAKKRIGNEELNALERANLQYVAEELKQLAKDFKKYVLCSEE